MRAQSLIKVRSFGIPLPPPEQRCCGREFKDDRFYVKSAETEARRLVRHFKCNKGSTVLDIGCGQGRLAIGLLRVVGALNYTGLDVNRKSVDWCNQFISKLHPTFHFGHVDVHNERYNAHGRRLAPGFRFNLRSESIDIVYLYSVFSHTTEEDLRIYLKECRRVLRKTGRLFFTAFAENRVPNFAINPAGYVFKKFTGPLHVVRYRKRHLLSIIHDLGFRVDLLTHATENCGQSAFYLSKKPLH